ncbi:ABC transporter ATP-binding protein [Streptomyces sp. NPDC055078]
MNDPVLRVDGLSVAVRSRGREVPVVRDVSLSLRRGEALGLVGESGSGKSMTALSILGVLPRGARITSGSVRLGDTELVGLPERQLADIRGKRVAMVFQDPMASLNPSLTVGEQIGEVLRRHLGASAAEATGRTAELLELVGIPDPDRRRRDHPHVFSGGMRQRVMIAMALACRPEVLIADEPTTALDVTVQKQILELLVSLQDEFGMALLLVTHDLGVIAETCHRMAVLSEGRLIEEGPVDELFTGDGHPYTAALLAAAPENAHRKAVVRP